MSASGKSSNRLSEYNRGYHTGSGHGPYALQGIADRKRHDELMRQQAAQDDTEDEREDPR